MKFFLPLLLCLSIFTTCSTQEHVAKDEVIYHLFVRSFYDSNGDQIGDLNGVKQKLDYLQELGVTSLLLLPICKSDYYHNYFSGDFYTIDPELGTLEDYLGLVKEMHKRGMKIYLDMETQYVTDDHIWFSDSYKNPSSKYTKYLLYSDSANTKTVPIFMELTELPAYDGTNRKVAIVNLNNKEVWKYNLDLFNYWVDPNKDGKFDDGADGFRLDHMMDDLDYKGLIKNMFTQFWKPLFDSVRKTNPRVKFIAEQAAGGYAFEYFEKPTVDRVFAFQIQQAILSGNKKRIDSVINVTFSKTPKDKNQVVFIESHDMHRFAGIVKNDPQMLRAGAALNMLIGGIPAIYYGQEIGMTGMKAHGQFGFTDANDIPIREAFEWYTKADGKGMAFWYKGSGPWDSTNIKSNDGISLEEQKKTSNSLWNYYKALIQLRKDHPVLRNGAYQTVVNDNPSVLTFSHASGDDIYIIAVNLSNKVQPVLIDRQVKGIKMIFGDVFMQPHSDNTKIKISLPPWYAQVWKAKSVK